MQPDPTHLMEKIGLTLPPIGVYDAPDPTKFEPLVAPKPGRWACIFMFYKMWIEGHALHITEENHGCGGAGTSLCGVETESREDFVQFLAVDEGLKSSPELMNAWLDHRQPNPPENSHIFIGPLKADQYDHLKSITFYCSPDQLSLLVIGANYHHAPTDLPVVKAPFGSGCSQMFGLFDDFDIPQAVIGATDIAMRQYLPPDILAFSVTKPLFEQLCSLDERSFLYKPFWETLKNARK